MIRVWIVVLALVVGIVAAKAIPVEQQIIIFGQAAAAGGGGATNNILMVDGTSLVFQTDGASFVCLAGGC